MLDKEIFKRGMQALVDTYPNWKFEYDEPDSMRIWYGFFSHMDEERFKYMIHQYVKHERAYPTIAGLLQNDTMPRKSRTQIEHEKYLKQEGLYQ